MKNVFRAISFFDRLGGEAVVNTAVDIFYCKVLADDCINRFFDGADMEEQAVKQKAFLAGASMTDIFADPFLLV